MHNALLRNQNKVHINDISMTTIESLATIEIETNIMQHLDLEKDV